MTSHWKAILGVILIFIFGYFSGTLCTSIFFYHRTTEMLQRGPEGVAEVLERRTTRNLDLDANQRQQVHAYFLENVTQRRSIQSQIQPQVQVLNRQTLEHINAILRPDQRERFHDNLAQFRKRFGRSVFNPNAGNQPNDVPPTAANPPPPPAH